MTPAARVAAAASILDQIAGGQPAEAALTRWARGRVLPGRKTVPPSVIMCLMRCAAGALMPALVGGLMGAR